MRRLENYSLGFGVRGEDRTLDRRFMNPVLYRLSYPDACGVGETCVHLANVLQHSLLNDFRLPESFHQKEDFGPFPDDDLHVVSLLYDDSWLRRRESNPA